MADDEGPAAVETDDIQISEEDAVKFSPGWRRRRVLAITAAYLGVWLLAVALIHVEGTALGAFILLLPAYLVTLAIAARRKRPKGAKKKKTPLLQRVGWQTKVISAILIFLLVYIPFAFVSNRIIPYAPLVEYLLFAVAIFILYRLIGRSLGVAPSPEALPPPSHRAHQQVVGAIDDPHYQKTVILNYNFVERGKGGRALTHRLERVLEDNGVPEARRNEILRPLEQSGSGGVFGFLTGGGKARRQRLRMRRESALRNALNRLNKELEITT